MNPITKKVPMGIAQIIMASTQLVLKRNLIIIILTTIPNNQPMKGIINEKILLVTEQRKVARRISLKLFLSIFVILVPIQTRKAVREKIKKTANKRPIITSS